MKNYLCVMERKCSQYGHSLGLIFYTSNIPRPQEITHGLSYLASREIQKNFIGHKMGLDSLMDDTCILQHYYPTREDIEKSFNIGYEVEE